MRFCRSLMSFGSMLDNGVIMANTGQHSILRVTYVSLHPNAVSDRGRRVQNDAIALFQTIQCTQLYSSCPQIERNSYESGSHKRSF
jgi:hypothetical protein